MRIYQENASRQQLAKVTNLQAAGHSGREKKHDSSGRVRELDRPVFSKGFWSILVSQCGKPRFGKLK
jgi:hypothetical protein